MTQTETHQRFKLPVVPGVAVAWVLIGALVLVFPESVEPEGMFISVLATTITILIVHFLAELFLGQHVLSAKDHSFGYVVRSELKAMMWMAMWVVPALIPSLIYSFEVITYTQAVEWTSRAIQILAGVLGYLVGWARGRVWWWRVLIGLAFVVVISIALLIEALTHTLVSAMH
ncbi:hypothetical protein [Aurantimicrobium minutum]|jgi:hypothetical protein|uniref:Uncharacterized protein n=1 Tax=Aurantimicrobium minutum TaxID=708131 RepID=A0A173LW98_9MICO|nr:hypothetical protein [Aurantimicrobium minutum]BAU99266.1 hypothetical protein AUMI_17240 [Aurantimicrobium minutum]